MKVLITGGTGFIGTHLVKALHARGDMITVLTRDKIQAEKKFEQSIHCIETFKQLDHRSCPEAIINLAGARLDDRRWSDKFKSFLKESRMNVTQQVVDYIKSVDKKPKVLVNGSAIGFYGLHGDECLSEDGFPNACFIHELCRDWEQKGREAEQEAVRVCLLRTGIVLGDGGALNKMLPAFKIGFGGPLSSGKQWFSWVHIDDLVSMILFLIDHDFCHGPFNATATTPVTNEEFSRILATVLHRPAFVRTPKIILKILFGPLAEELLLNGQRVLPDKFKHFGFKFSYPTLKPALENILN